jgi:peptidoglycan biosynthesis protein MviN/MurJ (putative lipid II flippase)
VSERRLLLEETSVSHSSVIVSASLLLTALFGAGQALLLAFIQGEGRDTDAFLAAYALYVVFAIFGGSLRASVVPLIGASRSEQEFRTRAAEVISRIFLLAVVALGLLLAFSPLVGQALTHGLPRDARWTAVLTLIVLAPAAFCQIHAAALSAVLTAARRFAFSSFLYVLAGVIGLGCSALLLELIGVLGAAFGLLLGASMLAVGHTLYLRTFGIHIKSQLSWLRDRAERDLTVLLIAGAALAIGFQASLAISLAAISGDPGAITAYTYAFFIVSLALSISSSSIVLVTLPDLVGRIAHEGIEAARHHFRLVTPYMFAVLTPMLVAFAAYGHPVLETIFGDSLSEHTVDLIYDIGLLLSLMAIPSALLFQTSAATLALGRSRWFLWVASLSLLFHAAIVFPLAELGPKAVAGGHIVSTTAMTAFLMAVTFGRRWPRLAAGALARSAPALALSSVFVLPRLLLGSDPEVALAIGSATVSALIYAGLVALLWPSVGTAFVDLFRRPLKPTDSMSIAP